jgi:hypothetical protein
MLRASGLCYAVQVLSLDDLLIAAIASAEGWAEQEAILRGIGMDDAEVESVRIALAEHDAEAVARIVKGPEL